MVKGLVVLAAMVLSALSIFAWLRISGQHLISTHPVTGTLVAGLDIILLLFFGWVAIRQKSLLVGILSLVQLGGLIYLLNVMPHATAPQLMVDPLSGFMFLLINIVSSIIAVFSLRYMDEEDCSPFRKKYFLSIIFWFIAAMNLVVSANNLEYFFLFFELTTLASYLLIRFRGDVVSKANAITALWMNQIGGVAILLAIYAVHNSGLGEATFTNLLSLAGEKVILLPLALMSIAALIKGAQMPFSKWLLGAMVAPTPVSALLHSSTMVKIAPFVILRLSPALHDTVVAYIIIGLTAFVFLAASVGALAQDNLKRILAHSTIALLALMMLMGAMGNGITTVAALVLMLFHGLSKSMLFLNAGVLEKVFHLKDTSDMDELGASGPFTAMVLVIGFMSLLLPPFGAFIGKWLSIETLGNYAAEGKLLGALTLVAIAFGGAMLTLLYFKVMGLVINRTGEKDTIRFEKTGPWYAWTIFLLLGIILISIFCIPMLLTSYFVPVAASTIAQPIDVSYANGIQWIGAMKIPALPMLIAFLLLPATLITAMFIRFKHVDRANEYKCGEKVQYAFGSFYFSTEVATPWFHVIGILFFVALLATAFFNSLV
ncbi:MAG TPA: proton-conducting transporter membrane subunit [Phnomibacter sp.]|nr:proton-conducting transporter membrane subunit [Phnomibacter sp.]